MTEPASADHLTAGRVLLLGGTTEARELARLLVEHRIPAVTSLAGSTTGPLLPPGTVRVGGFGGTIGLIDHLTSHRVTAVVDATHPFAAQMSAHAATACAATGVRLLGLARPGWSRRPDAATWHWVDSLAAAAGVASALGERPFLAIGRQELSQFGHWRDRRVLARVVDPPEETVPPTWEILRARGPFQLDDELELMRSRAVDVLVTKDSGGPTAAKLDAAARLGVPVVMVARPAPPDGVPVVATAAAALDWLLADPGTAD